MRMLAMIFPWTTVADCRTDLHGLPVPGDDVRFEFAAPLQSTATYFCDELWDCYRTLSWWRPDPQEYRRSGGSSDHHRWQEDGPVA